MYLYFVGSASDHCDSISRYAVHLEAKYNGKPVLIDKKYAPNESTKFISISVVECKSEILTLRDQEQQMKNTQLGRVDKMLEEKGKMEVGIDDILKPKEGVSLVFVEGSPGIGKTTLAWELCKKLHRKHYDLCVLLNQENKIEEVKDLFDYPDDDVQKSVKDEVHRREEGKRVLFVVDGYDQFKVRDQSVLAKLLKRDIYPNCSILITGRRSAANDVFKVCQCKPRHLKIVGFPKESIKEFACSVFSAESATKHFLDYVSNPFINSLMHVPLNTAIIADIFKSNGGYPLPDTLTEVYEQYFMTILRQYIESKDPENKITSSTLSNLVDNHVNHFCFKRLAELAFGQFEKARSIFDSEVVSKDLIDCGFLYHVRFARRDSYIFRHHTLQEFLAAYHIEQLSLKEDSSEAIAIFNQYCKDKRWELVWRFVAGLTKGFQFFKDVYSIRWDAFVAGLGECFEVENFFLHCLFEGKVVNFDYHTIWKRSRLYNYQPYSSSLDRYALGFCIANSSSAVSWHVHVRMWGSSDESLKLGLNSNLSGSVDGSTCLKEYNGGTINPLQMDHCIPAYLREYPTTVLHGIKHLTVTTDDSNLHLLIEAIVEMKNLTVLSVDLPLHLSSKLTRNLLGAVSQSKVTTLTLKYHNDPNFSDAQFLSSLHELVNSPRALLTSLMIEPAPLLLVVVVSDSATKSLCDVLFGTSSLSKLTLKLPNFTENSFEILEQNICQLVSVHINSNNLHPRAPSHLRRLLQNHGTILKFDWGLHRLKGYRNKAARCKSNNIHPLFLDLL